MILFEHFVKVLSLYLEARIRISIKMKDKIQIRIRINVTSRIRICIKVKGRSQIRICIRIKVMRIRNTDLGSSIPESGSRSRVLAYLDPDSDPDWDPCFWWQKRRRKRVEKSHFWRKKCYIFILRPLYTGLSCYRRSFQSPKRTSSTANKKFLDIFLSLWIIFAFRDPNLTWIWSNPNLDKI